MRRGHLPGPKAGHGYTILEAVHDNPFFSLGQIVRGHEFHYSFVQSYTAEDLTFAFRVHKGYGFDAAQDGLCCQNVMACYTHLHALGVESWAPALVRAAARFEAQAAQNLSPIPASA
jgi:cobyrinic acid a,c-diamide synthase